MNVILWEIIGKDKIMMNDIQILIDDLNDKINNVSNYVSMCPDELDSSDTMKVEEMLFDIRNLSNKLNSMINK